MKGIPEILYEMGQRSNEITEFDFKFGRNLLNKLWDKKIDMAEFLKECTYFMLNSGFNELRPKPLPTRPPKLIEYDNLSEERKEKISNDFWHQDEIQAYIATKVKIRNENKSNELWLEENLARLEQYGDTLNAQKVRMRLQEFKETH